MRRESKVIILLMFILLSVIAGIFYYKYTDLLAENHKRDLVIKDLELEETKKRQEFNLRQSLIKGLIDNKIKDLENMFKE